MTAPLTFTVPGVPVATARAGRRRLPSGKVLSFTPKKTASFQNLVRLSFTAAYPDFVPMSGPIEMRLEIYMPIPKSMSMFISARAKLDETALFHIKKPDGKNIRCGVEDALEGVAYLNDSQVCIYSDRKTYSTRPRVDVSIRQIQPGSPAEK